MNNIRTRNYIFIPPLSHNADVEIPTNFLDNSIFFFKPRAGQGYKLLYNKNMVYSITIHTKM